MTWSCIHSAWVLPILVNVLCKCHRWALPFEVLLSPIQLSMKIKHHSYSILPPSPKGSQASHNANSSSPFPRLSVILITPTLFQYASSKPALIPRTNSYFNKGKMGPQNWEIRPKLSKASMLNPRDPWLESWARCDKMWDPKGLGSPTRFTCLSWAAIICCLKLSKADTPCYWPSYSYGVSPLHL